jgi:hypothetical protein
MAVVDSGVAVVVPAADPVPIRRGRSKLRSESQTQLRTWLKTNQFTGGRSNSKPIAPDSKESALQRSGTGLSGASELKSPKSSNSLASGSPSSAKKVRRKKSKNDLDNLRSPKWWSLHNILLQDRKRRGAAESGWWIQTPSADFIFAGAILVQAVALGVDTELELSASNTEATEIGLLVLDICLATTFLIELILRIIALKLSYLCSFSGCFLKCHTA